MRPGALRPTPLTRAVAEALDGAPCGLLRLAKVARVPQSTLSRIRNGVRQATPEVAEAVARALEEWGTRCTGFARTIRQAQRRRTP